MLIILFIKLKPYLALQHLLFCFPGLQQGFVQEAFSYFPLQALLARIFPPFSTSLWEHFNSPPDKASKDLPEKVVYQLFAKKHINHFKHLKITSIWGDLCGSVKGCD